MSDETRIEFYERMRELGVLNTRRTGQRSELELAYETSIRDVAAAGYEQALRDVLGVMRERNIVAGDFVLTVPCVTDDDVMNFAAARGLDMEDA